MVEELEDGFDQIREKKGLLPSYNWYFIQLTRIIIGKIYNSIFWSTQMLKSYFKTAYRNMSKRKLFSIINISGLAAGMTCCILITLFVLDELSYDRFHNKADNIYRVGSMFGSVTEKSAFSVPPMANALLNDFPEVHHAVRMSLWPRQRMVSYKNKTFLEKGLIYADSSIFDVFTIPVIHGNPKTALTQPYSVVITRNISEKYFGKKNPVNSSLKIGNDENLYKVTGVVENCPENSHFQYELLASLVTSRTSHEKGWGSNTYYTYVVLQEDFPPAQLEEKFPAFIKRHIRPKLYKELTRNGEGYFGLFLEPLPYIHLNTDVFDNLSKKGSLIYVYVFSSIALFILIIACINYMNLSTARFAGRSKEVGMRKVLGSGRPEIIKQFMTESVTMSFISFVFTLVFTWLLLPVYNQFTGKELDIDFFGNYYTIPGIIGFIIITGILSGSYPAFFLSSFQPVRMLKKSINKKQGGNLTVRRILVIFQFFISVVIILSTFIVYSQFDYALNKDTGFDKDCLLVIHRGNELGDRYGNFKQELLNYSEISGVTRTFSLPGRHFDPNGHRLEGASDTEYNTLFTMYGDYDFAGLYGLELVKGRYFSEEIRSDENAVVINETAVRKLGLTKPVGTRFFKEFGKYKRGDFVTVVGVVKDFHFRSLHHNIDPMIIRNLAGGNGSGNLVSVKVSSGNIRNTINLIQETWNKLLPGQTFEYSFFDEDLKNLYRNDKKTVQLIALFSILSILIACLGLFGLISFSVEQRTKEIGIRKVLGAGIIRIIYILSREIVIMVSISAAIASPFAYYAMKNWLQNFAYRIDITLWPFIITGTGILIIAMLTVIYHTVKAARANPVKTLKYE